jgi:hypothetical protein
MTKQDGGARFASNADFEAPKCAADAHKAKSIHVNFQRAIRSGSQPWSDDYSRSSLHSRVVVEPIPFDPWTLPVPY